MHKSNHKGNHCGCGSMDSGMHCCKVDAVISVDDRGQTVLPKEIREKAGIKAGDKLAVITWGGGKHSCCITLMKADEMTDMIKEKLGPMAKELSSD